MSAKNRNPHMLHNPNETIKEDIYEYSYRQKLLKAWIRPSSSLFTVLPEDCGKFQKPLQWYDWSYQVYHWGGQDVPRGLLCRPLSQGPQQTRHQPCFFKYPLIFKGFFLKLKQYNRMKTQENAKSVMELKAGYLITDTPRSTSLCASVPVPVLDQGK